MQWVYRHTQVANFQHASIRFSGPMRQSTKDLPSPPTNSPASAKGHQAVVWRSRSIVHPKHGSAMCGYLIRLPVCCKHAYRGHPWGNQWKGEERTVGHESIPCYTTRTRTRLPSKSVVLGWHAKRLLDIANDSTRSSRIWSIPRFLDSKSLSRVMRPRNQEKWIHLPR